MNSLNNDLRCTKCPGTAQPTTVQPDHRYGDYIILRPDAASSQKLSLLAGKAHDIMTNTVGLPQGAVAHFSPNEMHLTIALPLKPMTSKEIGSLRDLFMQTFAGKESLKFDLIFSDLKVDGSYNFSFSAPNFAPGFDVRMNIPPQDMTKGHLVAPSHKRINDFAHTIIDHCEKEQLVDVERNSSGQCNGFKPHISLGKLNDIKDAKALHDYAQHTGKDLKERLLIEAAKMFKCTDPSHHNCPPVLRLNFDKVEILRVDSLKDGSNDSQTLYSLDIATGQEAISKIHGCSHAPDELFKSKIKFMTGTDDFTWKKGMDHLGKEVIDVTFNSNKDAQALIDESSDKPGGKVHSSGTQFIVKLGAKRMEKLFGRSAEKVFSKLK